MDRIDATGYFASIYAYNRHDRITKRLKECFNLLFFKHCSPNLNFTLMTSV